MHVYVPPVIRRLVLATLTAFVALPMGTQIALAADGRGLGSAPATLFWIHLADTHGIDAWNYQLSLPHSFLPNPWAYLAQMLYSCYVGWVVLGIWFIDWVLSMSWVKVLSDPMIQVGDALHQAMLRIHLVPLFLTISAFVAAMLLLRGKIPTAAWDVMMTCLVAVLATGALANPIHAVAGSDGYVVKAGQYGSEIAASLTGQDTTGKTAQQIRQDQTSQLVTTFVREPTELINFGHTLSGACDQDYTDVVKAGPYPSDSTTILKKIKSCDKQAGAYASPSVGMVMGAATLLPAAFLIFGFFVFLAAGLLIDAARAMFNAVKTNVTVILGILPGGGRGSLMLTLAGIGVKVFSLGYGIVFLAVMLLVLNGIFTNSADNQSLGETFIIVDVLIVVGLVVWVKERKRLENATDRIAQLLAQRPGNEPGRLPDRAPRFDLTRAASLLTAASSLATMRNTNRTRLTRPAPAPMGAPGATPGADDIGDVGFQPTTGPTSSVPAQRALTARSTPALPAGPSNPGPSGSGPNSPGPTPPGNGGPTTPGPSSGPSAPSGTDLSPTQRADAIRGVHGKTGTLLRAGGSAALAYLSGGSSALATTARATQGAQQTAHRARVVKQMAQARTDVPKRAPSRPVDRPASPTTPAGTPAGRAQGEVIQGVVLEPRPGPRPAPAPATSPSAPGPVSTAPTARPASAGTAAAGSSPAGSRPGTSSTLRRPGRSSAETERARQLQDRIARRTRPRTKGA